MASAGSQGPPTTRPSDKDVPCDAGQQLASKPQLRNTCQRTRPHHVSVAHSAGPPAMQLDNPREFYFGLPLVTRTWATVAVIATIGSALGLVSLEYIRLDWASVIGRVHVRAGRETG